MSAFFKNLDLSAIYKKRKASHPRKKANPFPIKVYTMLQEARERGWEDIVSWDPDGLSFRVHDIDRFVTNVLPTYFNQTQFKSFQRQLNFYDFTKIMLSGGMETAAYRHRYLIRGNQEMCKKIIRSAGQDKSGKESSSTSSSPLASPTTKKALIHQHEPVDIMHSLPLLSAIPTNAHAIDSDVTPILEQFSTLQDFENFSTFLNLEQPEEQVIIDEEMNFFSNFDDTPLALDDDAYFGETQCHLL